MKSMSRNFKKERRSKVSTLGLLCTRACVAPVVTHVCTKICPNQAWRSAKFETRLRFRRAIKSGARTFVQSWHPDTGDQIDRIFAGLDFGESEDEAEGDGEGEGEGEGEGKGESDQEDEGDLMVTREGEGEVDFSHIRKRKMDRFMGSWCRL